MSLMRKAIVPTLALIGLFCGQADAEVRTEIVEYTIDSQPFRGMIAYDDAIEGPRPGVIVVHEWWGHNDYQRERAKALAGLGYTAFAIDMYGADRLGENPEQAGALMGGVMADPAVLEKRFTAALELLRAHPRVDGARLAALGYCFGGGVVLHMARQGIELAGIVSMHGTLSSPVPAAADAVKSPLKIYTGGADPFVPTEQVQGFVTEMLQAGARFDLVAYPGVRHAFTNPAATEAGQRFGIPLAYDAAADRDSWSGLTAFLEEIFIYKSTP
ncbi:MAG: dienelactone hydrolase family protein [Xanthomonadaceae bacterium]|nr:dienelactone hydrolase family protein [Xanthomonadaceae bacterium]